MGIINFACVFSGDDMLESMTGYSKIESRNGTELLSIEIISENNRFLDLSLNLPEHLDLYAEEIKRLVAEDLKRGRVRITVRLNGSNSTPEIKLNTEMLKLYYQALKNLGNELQISQPITMQDLLGYPEVFRSDSAAVDVDELYAQVKILLKKAVDELVAMRRREGQFLAKELEGYLQLILKQCEQIEALSRQSRQEYFTKYRQSIAELCSDCKFDENRLIQEAGMLTKKLDITEECARLRSHVQQFFWLIRSDEAVGKKMGFLIQEMNREITTAGSKSENAAISHLVVSLKDELEKIREQIQNII